MAAGAENTEFAEAEPSALSSAKATAAELPSNWLLEVEPVESATMESTVPQPESMVNSIATPGCGSQPVATPLVDEAPATTMHPVTLFAAQSSTVSPEDTPPRPEQIVEALLFAGGSPLTAEQACTVIRGLSPETFEEIITHLTVKYRRQRRPYTIRPQECGYVFALRSEYRWLQERMHDGPREARLSQPALDVLSLVAYRQPISLAELDALRGADSSAIVRQLIRLGLIAAVRRADQATPATEGKTTAYVTTPRFLELFQLASLEDLPRLGDAQPG